MDDGAVRVPIERELDLHAFAPRDIPSVVVEYIDAAAVGLLFYYQVHTVDCSGVTAPAILALSP